MFFNRAHAVEALGSLLVFLILLMTPITLASMMGITLFTFFALRFFNGLGTEIEIRHLMVVIALLQWFVGPVLTYLYFQDDQFYSMVIDEAEYMAYVFPASLAFVGGLYMPFWQKRRNEVKVLEANRKLLSTQPNLDLYLIAIGSLAELSENYAPMALRFFLFLLSNLRFVGLYYLVLRDRPFKWWIFGAIMGWLFLSSVGDGTFHNLLLWLGFLFIILSLVYRFSFVQKIWIFLGLFLLVLVIQAVKHEFRAIVKDQRVASVAAKTNVFTDLAYSKLTEPGAMFDRVYMDANVNRINQGWIIARIMRYTPRYEPFANGETIREGLYALLPRFLAPDKIKAGGHANFQRFTGKFLESDTSMNLSILGEAYANFGITGGSFFMFVLGLFFNWFLNRIYMLMQRYPSLLFWLPLIFLQVVKAETDFATVINHLFKASIIVFGVVWGSKKFLNISM